MFSIVQTHKIFTSKLNILTWLQFLEIPSWRTLNRPVQDRESQVQLCPFSGWRWWGLHTFSASSSSQKSIINPAGASTKVTRGHKEVTKTLEIGFSQTCAMVLNNPEQRPQLLKHLPLVTSPNKIPGFYLHNCKQNHKYSFKTGFPGLNLF